MSFNKSARSKNNFEHASRDKGRCDKRDDDCSDNDRWNDNKYHDSHSERGHHDTRERDGCRDWGRSDRCDRPDVDLDRHREGIDLKIDIDNRGKNLCVDIDLGRHDLELKLDARMLVPDSGPVTALVGGEGNAVGEHTLVEADIFSRLIDLGSITVAFGTASFESTAVSGEGLAYAAADTFADISGADVVFIFTEKTTAYPSDGASWATDTSRTFYVAIDFEEFDLRGGPLVLRYDDIELLQGDNGWRGCGGPPAPQIEGNVAVLTVDALTQAETGHVDVVSSVLTVEDQLSSVSAMAVTGIG